MVLGRSSSRLLAVILNKQSRHTYFVATARDMSKKERQLYRIQKDQYDQNKQTLTRFFLNDNGGRG